MVEHFARQVLVSLTNSSYKTIFYEQVQDTMLTTSSSLKEQCLRFLLARASDISAPQLMRLLVFCSKYHPA
jgi:hypothetical protein